MRHRIEPEGSNKSDYQSQTQLLIQTDSLALQMDEQQQSLNDRSATSEIQMTRLSNTQSLRLRHSPSFASKAVTNTKVLAGLQQSDDHESDFEEDQQVIEEERQFKSLQIDHVSGEESFSHLNFFEQVQLSDQITNTVVTPFNPHKFVQLIENPQKEGQVLAVQLVHRSLKYAKAKIKMKIKHQRDIPAEMKQPPPHSPKFSFVYDTEKPFEYRFFLGLQQQRSPLATAISRRNAWWNLPLMNKGKKQKTVQVNFVNNTKQTLIIYSWDRQKRQLNLEGRQLEQWTAQTLTCEVEQHWLVYALNDDGSRTNWLADKNYCSVETSNPDEPIGSFLVDQVLAADQEFLVTCELDSERQFVLLSQAVYYDLPKYKKAQERKNDKVSGTCRHGHKFVDFRLDEDGRDRFRPLNTRLNDAGQLMKFNADDKLFYCNQPKESGNAGRALKQSKAGNTPYRRTRTKLSSTQLRATSPYLNEDQEEEICEPGSGQCVHCKKHQAFDRTYKCIAECGDCGTVIDTEWRDAENQGHWFVCSQQKDDGFYGKDCVSCANCMKKRLHCQKLISKTKLQHFYTKNSFSRDDPDFYAAFSQDGDKKKMVIHHEEDFIDAGSCEEQAKVWAIISLWEHSEALDQFEFVRQWRVQDPIFMKHGQRNGLPELLSVDGERVKFFSQTRVKSADKKENSQYIINELLLKDVQKSTSSSQKKRHFDYQTVDKDGIAGDDNLKEDYLAQRQVAVNSELARALHYAFNPKFREGFPQDCFRWPVVDQNFIGVIYRKQQFESYRFKVFGSDNDWNHDIRIEEPGIVLSYFVEQDKITIYSIPKKHSGKLVIDTFNRLQRASESEKQQPDLYGRGFHFAKDWMHEKPQEVSLVDFSQTKFLTKFRMTICSKPSEELASLWASETEKFEQHFERSEIDIEEILDVQVKIKQKKTAQEYALEQIDARSPSPDLLPKSQNNSVEYQSETRNILQFAIITNKAYFRIDVVQDDFKLVGLHLDEKIGDQFFIGGFESISKLQLNVDEDEEEEIGGNLKQNYTFNHFSLSKPSRKTQMKVTVANEMEMKKELITDLHIVNTATRDRHGNVVRTQRLAFIHTGSYEPRLCFAETVPTDKESIHEVAKKLPQVHTPPSFFESYPILIQPTQEPQCDKLMVANLAANYHQTQICLSPYKFLCFAEKSMQLQSKDKIYADLVVQYEERGLFCLLRISFNPWQKTDGLEFKIQKICAFDMPTKHPVHLLQQCILFERRQKTAGVQPCYFMFKYQAEHQAVQTIRQDTSKVEDRKQDQQEHLLEFQFDDLPLRMVCGFADDAFYVQRDRNDQQYKIQIRFLNPQTHRLESAVAWDHPHEIKAIQFIDSEQRIYSNETVEKMAVVNDKDDLIILGKELKQRRFIQLQVLDLRNQIDLFNEKNNLEVFPYDQCCYGERLVIAPIYSHESSSFSYLFKNDSETHVEQGFQGFQTLQHQDNYHENTLYRLRKASWVRKTISQIKEGNFGYFLTQKSPETNFTDLISLKHQMDADPSSSFFFVLNHAILWFDSEQQFCRQFNRKTMLLEEVYDFQTDEAQIKILRSQNQLRDCAFLYERDPEVDKQSVILLEFDAQGNFFKKLILDKGRKNYATELMNLFDASTVDVVLENNGQFQILKLEQDLRLAKKKTQEIVDVSGIKEILDVETEEDTREEIRICKKNSILPEIMTFGEQRSTLIFEVFEIHVPFPVSKQFALTVATTRNKVAMAFNSTQLIYFSKRALQSGEDIRVKCDSVPVNDWFSSNYFEDGIRIDQVNCAIRGQIEGITKSNQKGNTLRTDMIQISLPDQVLIWDLAGKNEIQHMMDYEKYTKLENFVRTTFLLYRIPEAKKRNFSKDQSLVNYRLSCNFNQTLWSFPGIEDEERSSLLQTFSEFDIMEMLFFHRIESKITNDTVDTNIDLRTMLADVYGMTMVQAFHNNPKLLQNIQEKIRETIEAEVKQNEARQDEDEDHILISKLYLTLKLRRMKFKIKDKDGVYKKRSETNDKGKEVPENDSVCFRKMDRKQVFWSRKSALQYTLIDQYAENRYQDYLIQLLLMAKKDMKLSDLVANYEAFLAVFKESFHSIDEFLEDCWLTTPMTEEVEELTWVEGKKVITFNADTTLLSEKRIREEAEKAKMKFPSYKYSNMFLHKLPWIPKMLIENLEPALKIKPKRVEVKIYDINYLLKDLNQFYKDVKISGDEKIYRNELVNSFLWQQSYTKEVGFIFVLYLLQIVLSWLYFYYCVPFHNTDEDSQFKYRLLKTCVVLLLLHQMFHEYKQISSAKFQYLLSVTNMIQLAVIVLTICIFYISETRGNEIIDFQHDEYNNGWQLIVLPSITAMLQGLQLLYWMNLFEQTSFYVVLLEQSFHDIKYFMLLLLICILTIGNATNLLDVNQYNFVQQLQAQWQLANPDADPESNPISGYSTIDMDEGLKFTSNDDPDQTKYLFFERLFDQYQIGLGDFIYGYSDRPNTLLFWVYFFVATFLTQIIMFNFLIAIMAATFERVMEKRELYALMARTEIYADFKHWIWWLKWRNRLDRPEKYIYVIKPVEEEGDEAYEGTIALIKQRMSKLERRITQESQNTNSNTSMLFREQRKLNDKQIQVQEIQFKSLQKQVDGLTRQLKVVDKMQKQLTYVANAVKKSAASPVKAVRE